MPTGLRPQESHITKLVVLIYKRMTIVMWIETGSQGTKSYPVKCWISVSLTFLISHTKLDKSNMKKYGLVLTQFEDIRPSWRGNHGSRSVA